MTPQAQLAKWIKRLSRGEDVLDELYAAIGGRLYYVALSVTRNAADAEEVLSDAFLAIVNKAAQFGPPYNAYGWCARITRNLALNRVRSRGQPTADVDDFYDLSDGEDLSERAADKVAVEQAMAALSPEARRIVKLYYFDDMTVREISSETGVPRSSVSRMLKAALETMKKRLT